MFVSSLTAGARLMIYDANISLSAQKNRKYSKTFGTDP